MKEISAKLYLSGSKGIREVSAAGSVLRRMPMEDAGAICVGKEYLFCADAGGAVWKIRRDTLMPEAIFCGGPGICDLCLSEDETRLYALLGDADSVLLIDCRKGRPLYLNHCGCNPSQLLLCGDVLAAAGGQSGRVHLYDAQTLTCEKEIQMPGPVQSIAMEAEKLYALCLSPQMDTLLVAADKKSQENRHLCGMPGSLAVQGKTLYVATQGGIHVFDCRNLNLLCKNRIIGRPDTIQIVQKYIIVHDPYSQGVYLLNSDSKWKELASEVNDLVIDIGD